MNGWEIAAVVLVCVGVYLLVGTIYMLHLWYSVEHERYDPDRADTFSQLFFVFLLISWPLWAAIELLGRVGNFLVRYLVKLDRFLVNQLSRQGATRKKDQAPPRVLINKD